MFTMEDKSGNIYTDIFNIFIIRLSQHSIILRIPWFKEHFPHIRFYKNTVTFDAFFCHLNCSYIRHAITVTRVDSQSNCLFCFPNLFYQTVCFCKTDEFIRDHCSYFLLYQHLHLYVLSLFVKGVNVSNIDKPLNCYSDPRSRLLSIFSNSSMSKFLSLSG